jgi:hypothetical protein
VKQENLAMTSIRSVAFASALVFTGWALPNLHAFAQATTPATSATAAPSLPGRPLWSDLSESQQQALMPLEPLWHTMNEPHKRKWLALSQNFDQLPSDEKNTLQSRMREWAALTPQQRTTARLNYIGAQKQIKADDKRALWEAYQALPEETKRKLAAQQAQPRVGAAPAVKPNTTLIAPPPPISGGAKPLPRIASGNAAPSTLLPVSPTASGEAPSQ